MQILKNIFKSFSLKKVSLGVYILSSLLFFGCKDELEIVGSGGGSDVEIEGDCIAFTIELNTDLSSRGSIPGEGFSSFDSKLEEYENYIDTQDKFRIFFFTESGDFLFGATDRTVSSLLGTTDQNYDNSSRYWYVRIPMTKLVDRDNQEYDIDKIKNYLKTHKFKIAVLANWPNAGEKVNPADWDDSEGTNSAIDNPSSTLKGNPLWNWSNSILNRNARPEDIRNINDLHHVYKDDYYGNDSRRGFYDPFLAHVTTEADPGYYMGEPTDWVKMRDIMGEDATHEKGWKANYGLNQDVSSFDSRLTANQWIRANWSPAVEINHEKKIYRHYQHMWFLWNLDAAYKTGSMSDNVTYEMDGNEIKKDKQGNNIVASVKNASAYDDNWGWNDNSPTKEATNPWGEEWYKRNGDALYQWMNRSLTSGNNIGEFMLDIGEPDNHVFFQYIPRGSAPAHAVEVNGNYGVKLPNIGNGIPERLDGMIKFMARTSGTLRVKWGSYDGQSAGLGIIVNETYRNNSGNTAKEPSDWVNPTDNAHYWDITVEGGAENIYIYGTQGQPVVYSIEFIRGQYLYETDREGIAPNPDQGIPMYGVKLFDKIDDWQKGTTINLPTNIALIRALAKVEVFISDAFGEPRHVYMRNANRAARCEPMDVETDTDFLWNNCVNEENPQYTHDPEHCEWFRIQKYGPSYRDNAGGDYTDWLAWFYGSWTKAKWKTSNYVWNYNLGYYVPSEGEGKNRGWDLKGHSSGSELESPRIFNPYYYRSDFVRFLYGGHDGSYYRYVLYLPEKNIDNPGVPGNMNATPRVPHIEYRFYPKYVALSEVDAPSAAEDDPYTNTEYNLDDNDCYRIYFTNYGYSGDQATVDNTPLNTELKNKEYNNTTYDIYEKSNAHLQNHWPIMRNHRYKLYVGGQGPKNPEIHVRVSDWNHGKVVMEW